MHSAWWVLKLWRCLEKTTYRDWYLYTWKHCLAKKELSEIFGKIIYELTFRNTRNAANGLQGCVYTVSFSSVFTFVSIPKRLQTLSVYDRNWSWFNTLNILSLGSCNHVFKTINETKTTLKALENHGSCEYSLRMETATTVLYEHQWPTDVLF